MPETMKYLSAMTLLGIVLYSSACASAKPDAEVLMSEREAMRVVSETTGKGPGDALNALEQAALERARSTLAEQHAIDAEAYALQSI